MAVRRTWRTANGWTPRGCASGCARAARPAWIELEPKVGGRLLIDVDDQGFLLQITGTYLDLDRPRRLSFTWRASTWNASDAGSVVTVRLEPHGGQQTLMTIRHELLPPDVAGTHERGWTRIVRQLRDTLLTHS